MNKKVEVLDNQAQIGIRATLENKTIGVVIMAQQKQIPLASMRMHVQSLALLSGLRTWHCRELWCRL